MPYALLINPLDPHAQVPFDPGVPYDSHAETIAMQACIDALADLCPVVRMRIADWLVDRLEHEAGATGRGAMSANMRLRDLSVLAYANGFTLWVYFAKGDDVEGVLKNVSYFAEASDMFNEGDHIHIVGLSDGAVRNIGLIVYISKLSNNGRHEVIIDRIGEKA